MAEPTWTENVRNMPDDKLRKDIIELAFTLERLEMHPALRFFAPTDPVRMQSAQLTTAHYATLSTLWAEWVRRGYKRFAPTICPN